MAAVLCVFWLLLLVSGRPTEVSGAEAAHRQTRVLIVGGGSSHDFQTSFGKTDAATLREAGDRVEYTESFAALEEHLADVDVVVQASNQTAPDEATRGAIMRFVARGGGLVVVHAGVWYNWQGWPEYNRELVGGGTRQHDRLGQFSVLVKQPGSPVMAGVPRQFTAEDELYHQEFTEGNAATEVLATATSPLDGKTYPSVWVVKGQRGRMVCVALGHDERTHQSAPYRMILRNAVAWTAASVQATVKLR